jgi:dimethylargininase
MKALIRRPSDRLAEGIVTHLERTRVDLDLAVEQWHGYVDVLRGSGWETVEVEAAPECPDSVFVEDTLVMYGRTAVVTLPGADTRRAETLAAEQAVRALGYELARIEPPGTLDGGDVLKVGSTVYVGSGGRTNGEGVRQLRSLLEPLGAVVIGVPQHRTLHLKSAVTALPDGTVVGYEPLVDHPTLFPRFLAVPEEPGAHVVLLGGPRLLMAADAPRTAELYAALGWEPVMVDISEYEKLEGCVTCLSVRLREAP